MARSSLVAGFGRALAAVAVGLIAQIGLAGGKLDPVKVEAAAGKPDAAGKQTVTVKLSIDKGWHIYANPVDLEELAPAQTVITIKSAGKAVPSKVKYPAGKTHVDKAIGTFKVYEDEVSIPVEVSKTDGALEVSVKFQACDEKRCLPPKTVKVSVP